MCLKKLYGGCSAAEESRVCAACGEEVCEDCSCAGAGDTVTLRTETRQQTPHSYQPHSGSTMVLFYLHKEEK